jgi:hypothetical protein
MREILSLSAKTKNSDQIKSGMNQRSNMNIGNSENLKFYQMTESMGDLARPLQLSVGKTERSPIIRYRRIRSNKPFDHQKMVHEQHSFSIAGR